MVHSCVMLHSHVNDRWRSWKIFREKCENHACSNGQAGCLPDVIMHVAKFSA